MLKRRRGKLSEHLFVVRMDIEPEKEEEFNKWYNTEHVPAILKVPGVLSGYRYVSREGTPKYMAVYELKDSDVLKSDAWKNAVETGSVHFNLLRPFFRNRTRNVYEKIYP